MNLKNFRLLASLDGQTLDRLKPHVTSRTLASKESLNLPNGADEIYMVRHGTLKLYRDDTISFLKYIYKQWDAIGILPVLGKTESPNQRIVALTDVILLTVQAGPLRELAHTNPQFCMSLQAEASDRIQIAECSVRMLHIKDVKSRLLFFLLNLAARLGCQEGEFLVAENLLTNQEIADQLSTSRQSVSSVLNQLKKENLVINEPGKIGVHLSVKNSRLKNIFR